MFNWKIRELRNFLGFKNEEILLPHPVVVYQTGRFDSTWRVMARVSILSRLRRNFLEKARDFPRVASRYENSWHPIFWPWLVGRILLFFRQPPWGLHSDRVATGFSISAYIHAHQQHVHVHVTTTTSAQILQPPLSHIFAYHATVLGTTPFRERS